jgi:hypothetical protein
MGALGCVARIRRQVTTCDYGLIDENGGADFDEEVELGQGGPGFGVLYGYTIFDAVAEAPGTSFNISGTGQVTWGFSIPAWYSAMAAQDAQLVADSREAYYAQVGATVVALQAAGASWEDIQALILDNQFDPDIAQLQGGNFDFEASDSLLASLSCPMERCDEGSIGTIDYSHDDGTLHLDTADPFNFPGGTFLLLGVDFILGNFFYFVIPR